jgi:hypothetical protein
MGATHRRQDAQEFVFGLGCNWITRYGAATQFAEGSWAWPELHSSSEAERQDYLGLGEGTQRG